MKRKETGKGLFFLNGRQEAAAGDETGGRKERKSEKGRGARKKESVWSESGPRVGEGNGLQVSAEISAISLANCWSGRGIFVAPSTHFTGGGTWSQLWLHSV